MLVDEYGHVANIYLFNTGKISAINVDDYDVILIMDLCNEGAPSEPAVTAFISNTAEKDKIILFIS